jgi:hypothetical protein
MNATPDDLADLAGEARPVPGEIWVFGWSFVAEGALQLLVRGPKDDAVSAVASMVLSALVVTFFAAGVVRARGIRVGIVAVLIGLGLVVGVVGLLVDPTVSGVLAVVFSGLQAWLLWRYTRTPWFAWQRTRPSAGPSLTPILGVAVLAGLLGGLSATPNADRGFEVRVSGAPSAP